MVILLGTDKYEIDPRFNYLYSIEAKESEAKILEPEMINWEIEKTTEEQKKIESRIYRYILEALLSLSQFTVKISIKADIQAKKLILLPNCWCSISLNNIQVLNFLSKDYQTNRRIPTHICYYNHMVEWTDKKAQREEVMSWTTEDWKTFFCLLIQGNAMVKRIRAQETFNDADEALTRMAFEEKQIATALTESGFNKSE